MRRLLRCRLRTQFCASDCEPITVPAVDLFDPQGLIPGMQVNVSPDLDGGEQPVNGEVVSTTSDTVSLMRQDSNISNIGVHFPRAGCRVDILG